MQIPYVELHCLSNFSFLRGASHPEELVERALALGYRGLALTDEASFAGSARAHLAWRRACEHNPAAQSFHLLHGSEFHLVDGLHIVLLAQNRKGYGNLCELITLARRQAGKGHYRIDRHLLEAHAALCDDTLALLVPPTDWPWQAATSVGENSDTDPAPSLFTAASAAGDATTAMQRLTGQAHWVAQWWPGRSWVAAALHFGPDDVHRLQALQTIAARTALPLLAVGSVLMHRRARQRLHDALTAVRLRRPLAQCGRALQANAERYLRPLDRLQALYPPALLLETRQVADLCRFSLDELRYEYPDELVPPGTTAGGHLRHLVDEGAAWRYPQGVPPAVRQRLDQELALITELHYESYFLTVHDIVRFARSRDILCQGRGSAANSAVCYCLGITAVDPDRMSTLFERFISRERNEPPDIDVDFEHQRREEVMQYVYAKYGRERAALTAALHTYRPRGALRDLGKAMGFSLDQVDRLAGSLSWWDGRRIDPQRVREAGFDPGNPLLVRLLALAHELLGFPRHLSQHSGGFVIARHKLSRLVPIENAAMADRTVIQWDKDDLDALGLLKVDILALGMLSCVRRAFEHAHAFARRHPQAVQGTRPVPGHPDLIPAEDSAVYDMLCQGDALGVFQVESRAQMNMLPRLRPRCYYDLVIQVAIVRPGPIQGGMVHPYLRRRQGLEPVSYPSVAVRGVLERTLGVSIFQEQVMQLAVVAAGFTPGEADQLRRAMAAWKRKGGIGPFRDKLVAGMLARGYTGAYADQIVRQIEGFGEYGFPESHAASFALLVYASAWLRCHLPAAFCAALLDAQPLGFYSPAQIVRDAMDRGVPVLPVCVQHSQDSACLQAVPDVALPGRERAAVRVGLAQVRGLSHEAVRRLLAAREAGVFASVDDLARRAALSRAELSCLAAADAFHALAGHRRQGLWQALACEPAPGGAGAWLVAAPAPECHEEAVHLPAPTEGQDIVADYRHTGLSLRRHPMALLRSRLQALALWSAAQVRQGRHRQLVRTSGLVTCRQRPGTASGVTFVTLEDETGASNIIVWHAVAERYRGELIGARLLTVYGRIERSQDADGVVVHVIASRLVDHSAWVGELQSVSRDFH